MDTVNVKGMQISVGDWVEFKCDIEQSGKVIAIKKDSYGKDVLVLENKNGFEGEYIGGTTITEQRASDCLV